MIVTSGNRDESDVIFGWQSANVTGYGVFDTMLIRRSSVTGVQ